MQQFHSGSGGAQHILGLNTPTVVCMGPIEEIDKEHCVNAQIGIQVIYALVAQLASGTGLGGGELGRSQRAEHIVSVTRQRIGGSKVQLP